MRNEKRGLIISGIIWIAFRILFPVVIDFLGPTDGNNNVLETVLLGMLAFMGLPYIIAHMIIFRKYTKYMLEWLETVMIGYMINYAITLIVVENSLYIGSYWDADWNSMLLVVLEIGVLPMEYMIMVILSLTAFLIHKKRSLEYKQPMEYTPRKIYAIIFTILSFIAAACMFTHLIR